jgi:hypothetical protein
MARVTRLGECLPIGRLFTSGNFLKIAEVAQFFGQLFYGKNYVFISTINGFGHILGDFF